MSRRSYDNIIVGGQNMKHIVLELNGLNCAGCAAKIEKFSSEIDGVDSANLDFVSKKLKIKVSDENKADRKSVV